MLNGGSGDILVYVVIIVIFVADFVFVFVIYLSCDIHYLSLLAAIYSNNDR